MKAVIILPTYNERDNIESVLKRVIDATGKISGFEFVILVVDDSSPDATKEVVESFAVQHKNIRVITGKKQGLGSALMRGMTYAVDTVHAKIIGQMDADASHDPSILPQFFKHISKGSDFVVGSRYISGGSIPDNWGVHRKIFSIIGNAIVRFGLGFTNVHDWTGGYRVFKSEYFSKVKQQMSQYSGYVYQIAFLHKSMLAGAVVSEVPIHFTDRRFGRSKIAPLQYIMNVLRYVITSRFVQLRHGPFAKFAVVGTIGFVINTAVLESGVNFGMHPAVSSAIGAECAIISNFILNNRWTFGMSRIRGVRVIPKFLQFNVASLGALLLQSGTVALGTLFLGASLYRLYYIFGVGLGMIWNYTMYSRVIWRK